MEQSPNHDRLAEGFEETAQDQIERLSAFVLKHVPGEPSGDQGVVDTVIRLLALSVLDRSVKVKGERFWDCTIGPVADSELGGGFDTPMRDAVQQAFKTLFGRDDRVCFSGWAADLSEDMRAVMEDRTTTHTDELIALAYPFDNPFAESDDG